MPKVKCMIHEIDNGECAKPESSNFEGLDDFAAEIFGLIIQINVQGCLCANVL